ncbi:hypothetical protein KHC28_00790 [Ancylobacter sonchi]|uniref:hypothetical protein n=1 Tax=Ancylobacter sonchi TaxID=1937790 RepID=UPI001BD28D07|nr:hypothetical protein [Ancylobacter sonchi]MBS7532200.1 hypothetical protein [Ancylobacter sonchi]
MKLRRLLLASTALLTVLVAAPRPVKAEPLSTALVLSLGPAFGTAAGGLTALGTIASAAITAGITYGIGALFGSKSSAPTPSDISGTYKQDIPSRMGHLGRRRVGGSWLFAEVKNGTLHQVLAHGDTVVDGWEKTFIDNNEVELDGSGWASGEPYPANVIRVQDRPGTVDQTAFDDLIGAFPGGWTADHRGRGIALSYMQCHPVDQDDVGKVYPNRVPTVNRIGRMGSCYDPRTGTSVWTRNLALHLAEYLTREDGAQIAPEYIDNARLAAAANLCDQAVPIKAGGTIPRYHGGLSWSFDETPAGPIKRLLTAMDGIIDLVGDGKLAIDAGMYVEPDVTIPDRLILDYNLSDSSGPLREANEVRVKYSHVAADYAEADMDPWRNEDDISFSGQRKKLPIEAFEIEHHNHARRIAKIAAAEAGSELQGWIRCAFPAIRAWGKRWVRFQIAEAEVDLPFKVRSVEFDTNSKEFTFQVVAMGAEAYAFDPATEEGEAPPVPEPLSSAAVDPPADVVVITGAREVSAGSYVPTLEMTWSTLPRPSSTAQAQISPAGTDQWTDITMVKSGTEKYRKAVAETVADNTLYDLRVRWRTPTSNWTTVPGVRTESDPTPPDVPTFVRVNLSGTDGVEVLWNAPNNSNFKGVRIYQGTTSNPALATLLSPPAWGAPSSSGSREIEDLDPDDYYFFVASINGSSKESARVPCLGNPIAIEEEP